ncbi:TPA: LOW QUALITY PROTEIN: hypothetical protein N0F65_001533 [Lagenidium giganteum]|uniref:AB hydrolase-1 domain-containing protein n=1 Tax=Lagenidium giganteum TaxID=4803 RepID=A0AAV2Z078_9STRA|nr:TPA: LOW QUALITY PROTEIN: hypothetical protein N0F65_001533 [Lagenidium giganteum]
MPQVDALFDTRHSRPYSYYTLALASIYGDDPNVFFVGHSLGAHTAISMAALNQQSKSLNSCGLALLSLAGFREHKAFMPRASCCAMSLLRLRVPFAFEAVSAFMKTIYFMASFVRVALTSFSEMHKQAKQVSDVPTFMAWSQVIEEDIFLQVNSQFAHGGPRFAFSRGGHNVQKMHAAFVARELVHWIAEILAGDAPKTFAHVRMLSAAPKTIKVDDGRCTLEYIDQGQRPTSPDAATIVLIHGSAGSYKDFRHMMPHFPPLHQLLTKYKRPSRPNLPIPQQIHLESQRCSVEFIDTGKPRTHTMEGHLPLTMVPIHGAPGSYMDFQYMIKEVADHARVVGLTLSGNGNRAIEDRDELLRCTTPEVSSQAVMEAIDQICYANVFLVGHSFRAHTVLNVAASNRKSPASNARGICLLAPTGLTRHVIAHPCITTSWTALLQTRLPLLHNIGPDVARRFFIDVLGPPKRYPRTAGIVRAATTDFAAVRQHSEHVQGIPNSMAWADDDDLISSDVFAELSDSLACSSRRARLGKGGRSIQKAHAASLAQQLTKWVHSVAARSPQTRRVESTDNTVRALYESSA